MEATFLPAVVDVNAVLPPETVTVPALAESVVIALPLVLLKVLLPLSANSPLPELLTEALLIERFPEIAILPALEIVSALLPAFNDPPSVKRTARGVVDRA